jgi:hypothetical protein
VIRHVGRGPKRVRRVRVGKSEVSDLAIRGELLKEGGYCRCRAVVSHECELFDKMATVGVNLDKLTLQEVPRAAEVPSDAKTS